MEGRLKNVRQRWHTGRCGAYCERRGVDGATLAVSNDSARARYGDKVELSVFDCASHWWNPVASFRR